MKPYHAVLLALVAGLSGCKSLGEFMGSAGSAYMEHMKLEAEAQRHRTRREELEAIRLERERDREVRHAYRQEASYPAYQYQPTQPYLLLPSEAPYRPVYPDVDWNSLGTGY